MIREKGVDTSTSLRKYAHRSSKGERRCSKKVCIETWFFLSIEGLHLVMQISIRDRLILFDLTCYVLDFLLLQVVHLTPFALETLSNSSDWQVLSASCAPCVPHASHASFTSFAWPTWSACITPASPSIALTRCQGTRQSCDTDPKGESHLIKSSWYPDARWLCMVVVDFSSELCWLTVALKEGWKDLWQLVNRSSTEPSAR